MTSFRSVRASGIAFLIAAALGLGASGASAQPFVAAVKEACAKEIKANCSKVTPGEGRIALGLLAFEDTLSRGCDDTLSYAAVELGKR